jgi:hypothetical protein
LQRHYEEIAAVGISLAGLSGIWVAHMASREGASYVLASVVLINLYACRFLGFRFQVGVSIAGGLVVAYLLIGLLGPRRG